MTATGAITPNGSCPAGTPPGEQPSQALFLAELTLAVLTIVAAGGLGRLLTNGGELVTTVFAVGGIGHLMAAVARRRRWTWPVVLGVASGGLLLTLGILHLWDTTTLGLPSFHTGEELRRQLNDAWLAFGEVDAPAPPLPGFIAATAIAAWVTAFVADTAAFRARTSLESLAPATALFVFGGALGTANYRLPTTGAFLAALLLAWLAQRALDRSLNLIWMGGDSWFGVGALMFTGSLMVLATVPVAMIVGPNLPGASAEALVPWRGSDGVGEGDGSRVTVSPLVDIRARIVDQATSEVFTVRADQRSYWRLTALERFDGRIWSSNRSYRDASGNLGRVPGTSDGPSKRVRQEFEIQRLAAFWLPTAYRPVRVEGTEARYNADSGTLITDNQTATGARYTVVSQVPDLTAAELARAEAVAPQSIIDTYTELPRDFSPRVRSQANAIAARSTSPYEIARNLQDFFRDGSFIYDLDIRTGHSDDALEEFLFDTKRGFCEQFAGAYAAMARAIGLPARVAVGFTPGELEDDGRYHVRGLNGHAWPEVYLDGFGWVAFEPTPGRGMPGAEDYTDVPEAQSGPDDPAVPGTSEDTTTTTIGDLGTPDPLDETLTAPGSDTQDSRLPAALVVAAVIVAVPLAWIGLLWSVRRLRRQRRRRQAEAAAERVVVAWDEVTESLASAGWPRPPWETPAEFAERLARHLAGEGHLLIELAMATTAASYGGRPLNDSVADRSEEIAARLVQSVNVGLERWERIRLLVDPRSLLPSGRGRLEVHETV